MNKIKVVCLGDSITYGFPFGPEYSWVRMLDDILEADFINRGNNGNTTSDMLLRFDKAVLKNNPSHLIIMGGINDVLCRESFDRIIFNIKTMVEKAQEHGIKVILGTPTAIDEPEYERLVERIRYWIKSYAQDNSLTVIDFASAFFDSNGNIKRELLLADGGHPTIEGYQAMFAVIDTNIFKD